MPGTVIDDIRAQTSAHPHHPALVVGGATSDVEVTYDKLLAASAAVAVRLRRDGVQSHERCGLVARQGRGFIEGALGILAAGCCLVPIPHGQAETDYGAYLHAAGVTRVVVEGDGFAVSRTAGLALDSRVDEMFRALDPAFLRFTSGTTYRHRGVILGHEALRARLAAANRGLEVTANDRIMWVLPMAHHFVVSILLYLRYGATILLPRTALAADVLALSERARATMFYASPYHYQLLARDRSDMRLDNVRLAVSTADRLREELADGFRARFGKSLAQALGIIEVGLPIMNTTSPSTKPTALGRPLPDFDVRLRTDDGTVIETCGPNAVGEIYIRGPGMFDAYLDPWMPAHAVVGEHGFGTGDYAWRDADGDVHLAGRRVNRISVAGMKFFCEEVEAVLDAHPGVSASRVSAKPHAHLGEVPIAEIVPIDVSDPPSPDELRLFCAQRLAGYKVPRQFDSVPRLTRTVTGKIARRSNDAGSVRR